MTAAHPDALVGHTGFVGGNLREQAVFEVLVNSSNAHELRGGSFGHVVFSAARAEKWRANLDPDGDSAHVAQLEGLIGSFRCERLTLISTVDVYGRPIEVDEADEPDTAHLHPYGLHRLRLERAARASHAEVLVVRLPGLYGRGLKKNVVYDLLHANQVDRIQPRSRFQYYDVERLCADVDRAWSLGLPLVNLVTEPVSTAEIASEVFALEPIAAEHKPAAVRYDVRSRHAEALGGHGRYIADRAAVLAGLKRFVAAARVPT